MAGFAHMMVKSSVPSPLKFTRAFYFFYYAALAALSPFLVLYYERLGFTGSQIGVLRGVPPLIVLLSAPLWGAFSDATHKHKRLLLSAIAGTLVFAFALSLTTRFGFLLIIIGLFAFFSGPVSPLMDNTVLALLKDQPEKYGLQRLWGAIGWGVSAPVVGLLSHYIGQPWIFYTYLILMACAWGVTALLPIHEASLRTFKLRDIRTVFINRQWGIFLLSLLFGSLHLAISNTYLYLYLNNLGVSQTGIGFSLTIATLSEIPVWFYANRMLQRWKPKGLLVFAFLSCAVQAFGYAFIPLPWVLMLLQLLHGPSFSAMWTAGVAYAAEITPPDNRATAQGLFGGVVMGLQSALGTLIGGLLYDDFGPAVTFAIGGISALIGVAVSILAVRTGKPKGSYALPHH